MQLSPWQPPHHISTYLVPPEPMSKDFHRPPIKINFKKKNVMRNTLKPMTHGQPNPQDKYLETHDPWPKLGPNPHWQI